MTKNTLYAGLRLLFVLSAIYAIIHLLFYSSGLIYPFIIAFIIAYLINPIVNFLNKKSHIPRALAVFLTLVLIFGALVGIVTLLIIETIAALNYLLAILPEQFPRLAAYIQDVFVHNIMPLYNDLNMRFNRLGESQQQTITENIQNLGIDLTNKAKLLLTGIITGLTSFLGALPNIVTVLIFILLATFFISNDWYRMAYGLERALPGKLQGYGQTIFEDLRKALFGFIRAQFTLISMTTIIVLVGLLLLRVPYAITIALITGMVDLLPYLGTGAVFVPWILYVWFTGDTAFAIGLLILYVVVIIQRQLMEPKVLSSNIGLEPLPTLIALFVGFKLYGLLGLIIGPVVLVVLKTLYDARVFHDLWVFIKGKTQ
ncbi:sporulation integral membrane protein YtvI [Ectobacillus antri]|uniref:Sporulation integral membrane protein YtvI n=1 Tax=Ectobacillus antri TaxID=2486280 RepID=A0ABT6H2F5_9BACI|nr:sporulation integral membrane protein YtvI [Ectobacillus antri]MDG4656534.1 sporulation integral membrane protein YtvI [Ectobacillus antri]MDG5753584.1 sporulation integral membrane protein YtvI [Ectobacillus antri]